MTTKHNEGPLDNAYVIKEWWAHKADPSEITVMMRNNDSWDVKFHEGKVTRTFGYYYSGKEAMPPGVPAAIKMPPGVLARIEIPPRVLAAIENEFYEDADTGYVCARTLGTPTFVTDTIPRSITPTEMKAVRQQLDLTQAELATVLGLGTNSISQFECGRL